MLLLTMLFSAAQIFAKSLPAIDGKTVSLSRELKMLPNSAEAVIKQSHSQSRAGGDTDNRTWKYVGKGVWADPWFSWKDGSQAVIEVEIEECVDQPGVLRIVDNEIGLFDVAPVVHCENPDKVYIEEFVYYDGIPISQFCYENGFEHSSYSFKYFTLDDNNEIIFPESNRAEDAFFAVYDESDGGWYFSRNAFGGIALPEDYEVGSKGDQNAESGVYFGITAFNYEPEIMPIKLLTLENKQQYKNFVNSRTDDDYTYLYYSAEQALATLKAVSYPTDLTRVTLITFTDGVDDGSLDKAPTDWDDVAYRNYIEGLISTAYVQGVKVDAYSIGLKGEDIKDYNYDKFKSNLKALATEPKDINATEVDNMKEVENRINRILDELETSWMNKRLSCNINMKSTGEKLRFTLDKSREELEDNADNSEVWIEGVFSRVDNSMNDVVYHGCTSSSGSKVVSKEVWIDERKKYQFTFDDLKDHNGDMLNIGEVHFWTSTEADPVWNPRTEFNGDSDAKPEVVRTSSAIMLVMDCSTSLGEDFKELKRIVNDLIDRIVPDSEESALEEVAEESVGSIEYYTLQGVKVAKPSKGLYIVKKGKNTCKVIL